MNFLFNQKNKSAQKIAYFISRIFEPFLWLSILGILIIFSKYFDGYDRLFWSLLMILFLGILPILAIWIGLKKGRISNIDLTKREERTPLIMTVITFWIVGLIIAWALSGPLLIIHMLAGAIIIALIILIINLYWKISNHTASFAVFTISICTLFNWHYWPLLFALPIISWSRWIQKKHTLAQLIAGSLISIVYWLILKTFGY